MPILPNLSMYLDILDDMPCSVHATIFRKPMVAIAALNAMAMQGTRSIFSLMNGAMRIIPSRFVSTRCESTHMRIYVNA